jgi:medium-chain acyl-[acyl-carrier-protein] hydrolase
MCPLPEIAAARSGRWIVPFRTRETSSARLICFPYAGAGAGIYRAWDEQLPTELELWAFQAPGREDRIGETPVADARTLIDHAVASVTALPPKPLILFGHSLGAMLAYETACALNAGGAADLQLLIVSGYRAPQLDPIRPPIAHLPDASFLREIIGLNGTPPEVFEHQELVELLLPMLRADFHIADTYRPPARQPLSIPVIALGSDGDAHARPDDMAAWSGVTSAAFRTHVFRGDHFYLNAHRDELVAYVGRAALAHRLTTCLPGLAPAPT